MPTSLNALTIRKRLNLLSNRPKGVWQVPSEFGPDGWRFQQHGPDCGSPTCTHDGVHMVGEILATVSDHPDKGIDFDLLHGSIVRSYTPTYADLILMHQALWGETGYAYQLFVPKEFHVNLNGNALHLFGRLDGEPMIPELSMQLAGVGRSI